MPVSGALLAAVFNLRLPARDRLHALRGRALPFLLSGAAVIPLTVGECRPDTAVVTAIPPSTVHVVALSECGALRCWSRWIEYEGRRIGESRACAESDGMSRSGDVSKVVPPSGPPAAVPAVP